MIDVPTTLDAVLDPGWLRHALDDVDQDDRIIEVDEIDSSQTLAQKVRFLVTVERADGARRTRAYCVKAHLDGSPGTDLLSEARFYGELAPRIDVRTPRAYYTAVDDAAQQAMIIMDDVVSNGGRFLTRTRHTPSTPPATASVSSRASTRPRGGASGSPTSPGSRRVPRPWPTCFPRTNSNRSSTTVGGPTSRPSCGQAANVAEAMRRTGGHEITCVIHGDAHSGNSYLDADGRACWLDWQVVQRGNWATDVSYHLATVLEIEERRAYEAELLRHYLRELESLGAPAPAWDDAWEQYTLGFSYGYFLWVITRISSRAVVLIHIPRLAAALPTTTRSVGSA